MDADEPSKFSGHALTDLRGNGDLLGHSVQPPRQDGVGAIKATRRRPCDSVTLEAVQCVGPCADKAGNQVGHADLVCVGKEGLDLCLKLNDRQAITQMRRHLVCACAVAVFVASQNDSPAVRQIVPTSTPLIHKLRQDVHQHHR